MLIVISGMPGSGKSTLARALANALHLPLLSRDEIYSGLYLTSSDQHSLPSALTSEMASDLASDLAQPANTALRLGAHSLLSAGVSVIIEAAFQQKLWSVVLEFLLPLAETRVIRCVIDPAIALQRMIQRLDQFPEQRAAHGDAQYISERVGKVTPLAVFDPVSLDVPTIDVETTDGYRPSLDTVVSFVTTQRFGANRGRGHVDLADTGTSN